MRRHRATCLVAVLVASSIGCGDDDSERPDPLNTVRAFYEATLEGDANAACRLLTPTAEALLTVKQPPPACEEAVNRINKALNAREREDMAIGLRADGAMHATRHGETADVALASRDSSAAGLHLQLTDGRWRIQGIDPGAVDGGQPTGEAAAIRRLRESIRSETEPDFE